MKMTFVLLTAIVSCHSSLIAASVTALRVDGANVRVDGNGSEAFWKDAPVITGLIQHDPAISAPPTRRTEVKLVYSATHLLVLAWMEEADASLIEQVLTRRDRNTDADEFYIDIDSYHDRRNGYRFLVNAGGTMLDGTLGNDLADANTSWDAVWEAAVASGNGGWTAEMAIPFTCLRFNEADEYTFGINVGRYIAYNRESVSLVDRSAGQVGYVSRFVELTGIKNIVNGSAFVQLPYVSLSNPANGGTMDDMTYRAGLDMAYGWDNGMVLNATVNPDFGQVEADRALIDLSGFETRFPEKRSFFLEGSRIFSTPYELFYSRRIGRSPSRNASVPTGGQLVDKPVNTTILGAAKVTGKTRSGLQYGFIEALTGSEEAVVADSNGNKSNVEVEPAGLYQVARLKQDVLSRSSVGLMATGRHYAGSDNAAGMGIDWDLELPHPDYQFSGQVVGSATRDDGWGYGADVAIEKSAGKFLTGDIHGNYDRPELNLNPSGFFTGAARKGLGGKLAGTIRTEKLGIRTVTLSGNLNRTWSFDDVTLAHRLEMLLTPKFDAGSFMLGYNHDFESYNNNRSAHGNLIGILPTQEVWSWITPELGKYVDVTLKLEYRPVWKGVNWRRIGGNITVRPLTRWSIAFDTKFAVSEDPQAFVTSTSDSFGMPVDLVGRMDQETFDLVTTSTFLFTNSLSLQFYNQLFTGITRYAECRQLTGAFDTKEMEHVSYERDADFRRTVCNANFTLRWEFRPGSTAYLVWTGSFDERNAPGSKGLSDGYTYISLNDMASSFMMKFDYRFALTL